MSIVGKQLGIAILGSGNIGCDLLVKTIKSPFLKCVLFVGRRKNSPGLGFANSLNITTSSGGADDIIRNKSDIDLIINASTASVASQYAPVFQKLKLRQLDLTPSGLGSACIPVINGNELLFKDHVNFVSCGAQAILPIVHALKKIDCIFNMVEVIVSASSDSIGLGTRENIDEYLLSTESVLRKFAFTKHAKAILNISSSSPPVNMRVTLMAKLNEYNLLEIEKSIQAIISKIHMSIMRTYQVVFGPVLDNDRLVFSIEIMGAGDYLPKHAGNLDIITRNAIYFAECIAHMNSVKYQCVVD